MGVAVMSDRKTVEGVLEEVERKLTSLKEMLERIPEGELTRIIRKDRETH